MDHTVYLSLDQPLFMGKVFSFSCVFGWLRLLMPSGRAITDDGRTCGPTLLLGYLYVKAIKYHSLNARPAGQMPRLKNLNI